jgi:hypothetical protein
VVTDGVRVFATEAARNSAIPSPIAGMVVYITGLNELFHYSTNLSWNQIYSTKSGSISNVFVGRNAGDLTTSTSNVAVGFDAAKLQENAFSNVAVGRSALENNVLGFSNTAVGRDALQSNTVNNNTAFGQSAGAKNTTGANLTALGRACLVENTTGSQNTGVGQGALNKNTTGTDNTAVGDSALSNNTTANNNIAIGADSMLANTTGTRNTAVGTLSLEKNTTGTDNLAVGMAAAFQNVTGNNITAIGRLALENVTGSDNTALGRSAGSSLTTGTNNTIIGFNAQALAVGTSNSITLGNSSISSLRCQVTTISSLSDQRDKKEIKDLEYGLDLINKVRPVEFTWDTRDGSITDKPDIGFIAQELAEVEDNLNDTDRLRLTLRDNPEKLEATPGRLLPIAIKAIQELSAQNADLLARLEKLENK